MKTKFFYQLIVLFLVGILIIPACKKKTDDPAVPSVQELIDAVVDSIRLDTETKLGKKVPTLNIFIQTPDETFFSSSADVDFQPITADTYFRFASNTKNFTSTAMLYMNQNGWVDINDKITDTMPGMDMPYVPDTPEWDFPYKDQITIKMLLNHSAGVYDVDNDSVPGFGGYSYTAVTQYYEPDHQFNTTEMINQLTINNLFYFVPGEGKHYSNTGYAIAGEIVARVYTEHSGEQKHLTDYLHDYLYGDGNPVPLQMYFPYLASDKDLPSPFSCGYEYDGTTIADEYCGYNMSAQVAEGNGYSTMRNLNTYIRTLLKAENILSAESVELMKTSTTTEDPHYGLGCFYVENLGYGHNGARIGNLSMKFYDPDNDVSLVCYINCIDFENFPVNYYAMPDLAYAVREILGYPGKPE
jgi:D-alanyl-D-alanine carboxypeptidase